MVDLIKPTSMTEWGSRYIAELVKRGISKEDAMAYWVQSIMWPNGEDLTAILIDMPEVAAAYDIKFLKQERKPLE
jgi:hypothetical protein